MNNDTKHLVMALGLVVEALLRADNSQVVEIAKEAQKHINYINKQEMWESEEVQDKLL